MRPSIRSRIFALLAVLLTCGAQASDVRVEIEGLEEALEKNVRGYLSIQRYAAIEDLTETNIRSLHSRARNDISAALKPFGYYNPTIQTSLRKEDDRWTARYVVAPGEPVLIDTVNISLSGPGEDDPPLRAILKRPGIRKGDHARHEAYENVKRRLREVAAETGYRDARFEDARLEVDPERLLAHVELAFATGIRYRFGDVRFEQSIMSPELLRRYPTFSEGDPFNARKLLDLQYALYDSEYFSTVQVSSGVPVGDIVPVIVNAQARPKQKYTLGVGYGTDTRARATASWANRRVNRRGHRLRLDLELSAPRTEFGGQYVVPLDDPVREHSIYAFRSIQEELGDTDSDRSEVSVTRTSQLSAWQRKLYTRLSVERTSVMDDRSTTTLLVPGTTWSRTRSDDPVLPRRGTFLKLDLHGTHSALGSDANFLQARVDTRFIWPAGRRNRLILRASAGSTLVSALTELPASERFFAGGDQSVRGFGLNGLGPRDADGNVIGGKHLLFGSVEFERRIFGPWAVAAFVDAGNAIDDFTDRLEYSVGLGLRYESPVGMIRVDVAQVVSEGKSLRLHFNIGPEL